MKTHRSAKPEFQSINHDLHRRRHCVPLYVRIILLMHQLHYYIVYFDYTLITTLRSVCTMYVSLKLPSCSRHANFDVYNNKKAMLSQR